MNVFTLNRDIVIASNKGMFLKVFNFIKIITENFQSL